MKTDLLNLGISELTGIKYRCKCGRCHEIQTKKILLGSGALHKVYDIIRELDMGNKTLIIADINTLKAAGEELERDLTSKGIALKMCIFEDNEVHADEKALGKVLIDIDPDVEFIIAVGSGTINDIARFISFKFRKPYIAVATAPSMDGYASSVSPLIVNGFKKTFSATFPIAIIGDTDILSEAPHELIAAGVGDMLGKVTALADWKLSSMINDEYYCPDISKLVIRAVKRCIESVDGLVKRNRQAVQSLTEGLILSGIAMQMAGNSRPASGAEHHVSHYWEMRHLMEGRKSPLHGIKVGVATTLVLLMYNKIFKMDKSSLEGHIKTDEEYTAWKEDVLKNFGVLAEDVIASHTSSVTEDVMLPQKIEKLKKSWDNLITEIRELFDLIPDVGGLLRKIGAPGVPGDIGVDFSLVWSGLRLAKEVRERYTVLQLADQIGVLNKYAHEIAEEYSQT
ncbi:MAG TPA: sn-glycerol-1-phosphate dehydrogenase [Clostridiaceae bacterium]|nr:sn-glycerol-1-phosphate dehydrogenase [Clostridiaceae bacterium]